MTTLSVALFSMLTLLSNVSSTDSDVSMIPQYQPRFGRPRPVVVVLGDNAATETTDYVVPYGILAESGVADVLALSTEPGPIRMRPALRFRVHATIREFDAQVPLGADYVIVPNIYDGAKKEVVLDWVRSQAQHGATIVGICDGVPVLANAGLLEGRRATGHWRTIDGLERSHPGTRWLRNRRYVADGNVITTSGVSASIPISIALVEAIAGRDRAEAVARRMGVGSWSPVHDSSQFSLRGKVATGLMNKMLPWRREELGIRVEEGVDEIALAVIADSWSRTWRSSAYSIARSTDAIRTRRGLTLLPDRATENVASMLPLSDRVPPAQTLDGALAGIEERYGERTAALVAVQIEYPWRR